MFSSHPLAHESNTFADDKGCWQLRAIPCVSSTATISPVTTSTMRDVGEGEPTRAHGKTEGWGSRDVQIMSLSG